MSNFFADLINRTAMLGRVQGDLRDSRAGEMDMLTLYNKEQRARIATRKELSEAREELREWQVRCDAFRLLSRKYGLELGRTEEQRISDRHEITLGLAEENIAVAYTKFVAEAREALGKTSPPA